MTMIEPPDRYFVRTGRGWPWTFWERDDQAAKDYDPNVKPECRWFDCSHEDGGEVGPRTWEHVSSLPNPHLVHLEDLTP